MFLRNTLLQSCIYRAGHVASPADSTQLMIGLTWRFISSECKLTSRRAESVETEQTGSQGREPNDWLVIVRPHKGAASMQKGWGDMKVNFPWVHTWANTSIILLKILQQIHFKAKVQVARDDGSRFLSGPALICNVSDVKLLFHVLTKRYLSKEGGRNFAWSVRFEGLNFKSISNYTAFWFWLGIYL